MCAVQIVIFKLSSAARAYIVGLGRVGHIVVKANRAYEHLKSLQTLLVNEGSRSACLDDLIPTSHMKRSYGLNAICNSEPSRCPVKANPIINTGRSMVYTLTIVYIGSWRSGHEFIGFAFIILLACRPKFVTVSVEVYLQEEWAGKGHG